MSVWLGKVPTNIHNWSPEQRAYDKLTREELARCINTRVNYHDSKK